MRDMLLEWKTNSFDDISGMYYDWDNEEEVTVSGRMDVQ